MQDGGLVAAPYRRRQRLQQRHNGRLHRRPCQQGSCACNHTRITSCPSSNETAPQPANQSATKLVAGTCCRSRSGLRCKPGARRLRDGGPAVLRARQHRIQQHTRSRLQGPGALVEQLRRTCMAGLLARHCDRPSPTAPHRNWMRRSTLRIRLNSRQRMHQHSFIAG